MNKSLVGTFSLLAALGLWFGLYWHLEPMAQFLTALLPLEAGSELADAVAYFLYDTPKVLLLLSLAVFVMGVVRSFFSPEKTRALLAGRHVFPATLMAALLGVVTPFCSCSAVPLFIGFVSAGVPLGVTFAFLVAAPMVNEVALGLLIGLVGWKVAVLYALFGLGVAVVSGLILGRLRLDGWLEDWVRGLRSGATNVQEEQMDMMARYKAGLESVREILGKVWLWVVAGVAIGAGIHGHAPEALMHDIMGAKNWWSVPLAVGIGVPLYSNAAGILPIASALLEKGAALGSVLAFMMAVTALSLPEMIILRKVLKVPLIATFVGVVATGLLCVGYLFNFLFS